MAIVQTEAELQAVAAEVGVPKERASDIKALEATVTDTATLAAVVNTIGYYDEKADHLVAAGVTFTP